MRVLAMICVLVSACAPSEEDLATTQTGLSSTSLAVSTTEARVDATTSLIATTTTTTPNVIRADQVDLGDEFGPADSLDVVHNDGTRWLAAGWKATPDAIAEEGPYPRACWFAPDLCEGAIWQSVDGVDWNEPVLLGRGVEVAAFAGSTNNIIALGTAWTENGMPEPAVWTPSDSDGWVRVEAMPPDEFGRIRDGASDGNQFVAVGSHCHGHGCLFDVEFNGLTAVWVSEDGQTWEQAEASGTSGVINRIVHTGRNWVAVGDTGNPLTATAWMSTDGPSWTETAMPPEPNPGYKYPLEEGASLDLEYCYTGVKALAADPDGRLIASGICIPVFVNREHSTAWYSDNGLEWVRTVDTNTAFEEPGGVRDAIYAGNEFLLVGYVGEPGTATVWTSPDGQTWALHSLGIDGSLSSIAIADGTIHAVGSTVDGALITKLSK